MQDTREIVDWKDCNGVNKEKECEYTSRMMTHHVNTCVTQRMPTYGQVMPKSTRWIPGTQGISYMPPHGARRRPYGQACAENSG